MNLNRKIGLLAEPGAVGLRAPTRSQASRGE